MLFRQLFDRTSCTYTYIVASDYGHEAIIIDPVRAHLNCYLNCLKEYDLKLLVTLDTHVHADHITASGHLRNETQCEYAMGEKTPVERVNIKVKENELIVLDDIKLKAIYTPGHTDNSYSFVMDDRVFTGDTLLIRGTGRTDFQNGDAQAQYDSLFNKLLRLDEKLFVYPAHDYKGMTVSTIGEEKRFNPRLQVKSKSEYVDIMNKLNLDKPKLMDVAVPENLQCGMI